MSGLVWVRVGALLGALAVAIGAFGAHGLKGMLDRAVREGGRTQADADHALAVFETGTRYHLAHALAVVAVGLVMMVRGVDGARGLSTAGWSFVVGCVLFSGSLYLLGVTGLRWLGAITPFGGLALIAGWIALAWAGAR
jgi:uncharacterized membrane protein YgdD (TMEM256/DUF423 family)